MVHITPWRRARDEQGSSPMTLFRSEFDRLFDRFFDQPAGFLSPRHDMMRAGEWFPSLDVTDAGHELVIEVEVPGMEPKDIEINVTGSQLTISGERREESERTERGWKHSERHFGSFRRVIELPDEADPEQISADCRNGVLTLHVPKSKSRQPKQIRVKAAGDETTARMPNAAPSAEKPPTVSKPPQSQPSSQQRTSSGEKSRSGSR